MLDIEPKYYRKVFPLTPNQSDFLWLVDKYFKTKNKMPSFRHLVAVTGVKSTWAITKKYEALLKKGYVVKVAGGYKLTEVSDGIS